ncbi:SH3 domain-containing protein 1 [Citrus sinensis]|uniref:SH3 domain-containing protein 1 n=1 Tax=Citrus sinensis TaxID=2711 RepID=A0ACB8KHD2_CITSI|nr:SH3 domain-containing protein 1 [Citrus sinensis]
MLWLMKLKLSVTNNFKIYTIPPGQLRYYPPLANNKTLFDIDLLWLLHFQRNIVRGVEGFVAFLCTNIVARKLAEDCCKYGAENQSDNSCVARAALQFGTSHDLMENERETLLGILRDQVSEPLRALINGAPLEDARHLTHRYDKLRHEVEAQAAEVFRRRSKIRESDISAESAVKLRNAEARLTELKSTIMALGREATAAMLSVESQQQQMTYQRLFAMVIHPFDAQANGELSLSIDDYVVVRQVAPIGWSEGECKGQAGWFPSAYVERQEKAPASKISEANSSPECDVTS